MLAGSAGASGPQRRSLFSLPVCLVSGGLKDAPEFIFVIVVRVTVVGSKRPARWLKLACHFQTVS